MSNSNTVAALKDVVTNSQLQAYISEPIISDSTPEENDGRYLLTRVYSDDKLNWCRALDQSLVERAVCRNFGLKANASAGPGTVDVLGLPGPAELFNLVWGLVPGFVKDKISQWAKENKDGAIANEIASYVKMALGMLPLPIPAFFINATANLVIPPLVSFIIGHLAGINVAATDASGVYAYMTYAHTAESIKVMKDLDRRILLDAGLSPKHLPPHLKLAADNDLHAAELAERQPSDQDCRTDMEHFYQSDAQNGCKSLQLMQIIAAQVKTNPECDKDPATFGAAVFKSLDSGTQQKLKGWAKENPPNRDNISKAIYVPIFQVLSRNPYFIPKPILHAFTSMKAPEVIEWLVSV